MLKNILKEKGTFIIAEVGQNHQGSVEEALRYIRTFASMGADAVKFQTRNNQALFDGEAYNKPYDSENAFADTYGAHREALELPLSCLQELKKECHRNGVKFMSTPFDEPSLQALVEVGVDVIKVASFDSGNLPFLKLIAETGIPVVISCGGSGINVVDANISALTKYGCPEVAILHCVSEYPASFDILSLDKIKILSERFPDHIIGLSDHFNGILSGPLGYVAGARVFEKHVTFDRSQKGTDHSFALEPDGFRKFARDIRRTPEMLAVREKENLGQEPVFRKLGKTLVYNKDLKAGEVITIKDLSSKIFSDSGIPVRESQSVIGRILLKNVSEAQICAYDQFSD